MHLREIAPSPVLAAFVRLYRIIDLEFSHNDPIPPKIYTPRPEQCLQFFPTPTIISGANNKSVRPKNALIIGQQTTANDRTVFRKFLSFQVVFKPGALYRLIGIPLTGLTDQLVDAEDVFGQGIEQVNDQLFHAKSHQEMVDVVELFLTSVVKRNNNEALRIDTVAQQMLNIQYSLDKYISDACLSHRQFDRKFHDRIGTGPKEYMRIIRFDQAYRMKNNNPEMRWFDIAIACGYYDLQHLSKDYKAFTGHTPTVFFTMGSPERLLGTEEVY